MNNNQIYAIVSWIKSHPQHSLEFKGDTSATIFLKFISDPELIWEYENPNEDSMPGNPVKNGCNYTFLKGSMMHLKCKQITVKGKTKCKFHNTIIFSDRTREFIRNYHIILNEICNEL